MFRDLTHGLREVSSLDAPLGPFRLAPLDEDDTRLVDPFGGFDLGRAPGGDGDHDHDHDHSPRTATAGGGAGEYIELVRTGDPGNRVDIWYVGDGYLASQRQDLIDDVTAHFNDLVSGKLLNDPFGRYQDYFNVHIVFVASAEEGADRPEDDVYVETAFDASYSWQGGPERLLYINNFKAEAAIADVQPKGIDVDMRFAIVNSDKYGGGGGLYAAFAAGNVSAYEVALHEVGHSFADLADEYWTDGTDYVGAEPQEVNVSMDATGSKWDHWHGFDDGVLGPIGAFEGGKYVENGIYRPTDDSKMRSLNRPFDAVAKEQFVLKFYQQVDPLDDFFAPIGPVGIMVNPPEIWVDAIDLDTIVLDWSLDGTPLDGMGERIDIAALGLAPGEYTLSLTATDDTALVRTALFLLTETVEWTFTLADSDFPASGGNDQIWGTAGGDEIEALEGEDIVIAGLGDDTIVGGSGNDELFGGDGDDVIYGDDFG